jgi:FeS assembly SUF system regulator
MLRITKLTDYAIVVLTHMARDVTGSCTSRSLAQITGLPQPSVSKMLKSLARAGVVRSERGVLGGYRLARGPESVSIADVIDAVEGPISLTECSGERSEGCEYAGACALEPTWARINHAVRRALADISLADIAVPVPSEPQLIALGKKPGARA